MADRSTSTYVYKRYRPEYLFICCANRVSYQTLLNKLLGVINIMLIDRFFFVDGNFGTGWNIHKSVASYITSMISEIFNRFLFSKLILFNYFRNKLGSMAFAPTPNSRISFIANLLTVLISIECCQNPNKTVK